MALSLAACVPAGPPPPAYLMDPADPDRPVAPLAYQSVTGGTKTFRPVDPKGWEQQNRNAGESGMGGMPGMGHGGMKGMDHGAMGGMDHSKMKGMGDPAQGKEDGSATDDGAMNGMKGMGGK